MARKGLRPNQTSKFDPPVLIMYISLKGNMLMAKKPNHLRLVSDNSDLFPPKVAQKTLFQDAFEDAQRLDRIIREALYDPDHGTLDYSKFMALFDQASRERQDPQDAEDSVQALLGAMGCAERIVIDYETGNWPDELRPF